ncbi:MAG TPA: HAD family hydrolase [Opitutaceae bacterium]
MSATAAAGAPARPSPAGNAATATTTACLHCGTSFVPEGERGDYCCAGCEYVHRLITGQRLDRFYQLRAGPGTPVRPVVFQPRDHRWLEGLVKRADDTAAAAAATGESSLDLDVQGIACVGCVWLIDRIFRERAGARGIRVNATLGRMALRWEPGACDVVEFARELQRFGYLVGPASKSARRESSLLILRLGLCAAFAMNGMLFSLPAYLGMEPDFPFARLFTVLSFVFASLSLVVGGTYFFTRSWRSLRRGVIHIDLPISLGILVGYGGSIYAWSQAHAGFTYFDFVSTFTFLMLVGRWTQLAAVESNRNRLLGLNQDLPPVELAGEPAVDGHRAVSTKSAQALVCGDRFRVAPGEIVPVSSTVIAPASSFGLDWINGESDARAVAPGQLVESGAINVSPHAVTVEAVEGWSKSLLARLLAVQPPSDWRNRTLERVVRNYLVAVLAIAAAGGAVWLTLTGNVNATLQVVISVLVVSCPCAIGVTLPLIDELAVARLRHAGLFVRSEDLWARLRRVRKVIFDKTGTLTLESLVLRNPSVLRSLAPEAVEALAALVRTSRHPAASCVREAMLAAGLGVEGACEDGEVREEVGFGLEWRARSGTAWRLGRPDWAARAPRDGGDVVLGCNGVLVAEFMTAERVRADAREEIGTMRSRGLEVFIFSGDRPEKVAAMARCLNLPESAAVGAMTPVEKADRVRAIDCEDTLMIGDGANDSLAFAAASCRGTPAIERGMLEHRADFFFLGRGLAGINRLLAAAAARRRTIKEVLAFAVIYNAAVVVIALAGLMSSLLAAVLMPASALASLGIAAIGMRGV